jgi:hypothetical protein
LVEESGIASEGWNYHYEIEEKQTHPESRPRDIDQGNGYNYERYERPQ